MIARLQRLGAIPVLAFMIALTGVLTTSSPALADLPPPPPEVQFVRSSTNCNVGTLFVALPATRKLWVKMSWRRGESVKQVEYRGRGSNGSTWSHRFNLLKDFGYRLPLGAFQLSYGVLPRGSDYSFGSLINVPACARQPSTP